MTTPALRILCLGASISAGSYRLGLAHHPYAIRLKQRLQQHLSTTKIEIDVDALSGDRVIGGQYLSRLTERLSMDGIKFDWIIVQGGGNDIGYGRAPEDIYEGLKKVWRLALDSGAKVLAVTVTETADRRSAVRARYEALNKLILESTGTALYVADVCKAIPWPADKEEQSRIWDDGLHFTKAGYDMIGDVIADGIISLKTP